MPDCELIEKCPFFNNRMAALPSLTRVYQSTYCREDSRGCARYRVYRILGRDQVPQDLYPHMLAEADELLAGLPPLRAGDPA